MEGSLELEPVIELKLCSKVGSVEELAAVGIDDGVPTVGASVKIVCVELVSRL